ncbi:OLC1v1035939C2 [Oldenlandia corymbosa var. corymbosa]|nr:OLC1v1035939C2 [Oldenlandia corymbosa var. corymbosa]
MVEEMKPRPVLTAPLLLDGESDNNYRAPNVLRRVLSLLNNVRSGSDLTRFQLPPSFNLPKSQLQCYGESVYSSRGNLLSKCANGESPLERFLSVVAWSISTTRPLMFGVAPYNPILGETHHVSRSNLNVLLEQVSHHPPVTALHATDENDNIEMIWCHHPVSKFHGTYIETEVHGKRQLKLLNNRETYLMNSPKLVIKFLPLIGVDWLGDVTIKCEETGLTAVLFYKGNSILPRVANHRAIKGEIFMASSPSRTIYEINGHWDRIVTARDPSSGKSKVIYNAKEVLSEVKTPIVRESQGILPSESTVVWGDVSQAILDKCWEKAKEAKSAIEGRQREMVKERNSKAENWVPEHFTVSYSKESGWECQPNQKLVPPAPIIVPESFN